MLQDIGKYLLINGVSQSGETGTIINEYADTLGLQVIGTFTGLSLIVEGSEDGTDNYSDIVVVNMSSSITQESITAEGLYEAPIAEMKKIRLRVASISSGSVSVYATMYDTNNLIIRDSYLSDVITEIPEQFKREAFLTLLNAWKVQLIEVENVLWSLRDKTILENSIGAQLDMYGKSVGISRNNMADDEYRDVLIMQKRATNGNASNRKIIQELNRLGAQIGVYQINDGKVEIEVEDYPLRIKDEDIQKYAMPAGVQISII